MIETNKGQFLGHQFEFDHTNYEAERASKTTLMNNLRLEVSEWHIIKQGGIAEIVAYYQTGSNANQKVLEDYPT